jgi:Transposase IS4
VRGDGSIAVTKWLDSRAIFLCSTKSTVIIKEKKYSKIKQPEVVNEYNKFMGGVDLLDRIISKYYMRQRTNKWTI